MHDNTFERAYHVWYPAVVRSAWSITRDLEIAEELAQEAFVKAFRRWRSLGQSDHAEPWIHRAVMNLALSSVRRTRRGRQLEEFTASQGGHVAPQPGSDVVGLLHELPRRQREAVFLRVIADLAEKDVAALMGCSAGSVKVHKKRGLERLRALVTDATTVGSRKIETAKGAGHAVQH